MKKVIYFILVIMLIPVFGIFPGGQPQSQSQSGGWQNSPTASYVGPNRSYSGYPLPITEKPTELTTIAQYNAIRPDMDTTAVIDCFEQKTNIRLKVTQLFDTEQTSIIFASRDFPDFMMVAGAGDTLVNTAIRDGDIIVLDDLLQRFSPTWWKFLNENKAVKTGNSVDGKVYFLPFIYWAPSDRNIRDQTFINQKWLNELGLNVPTNINELTAVLTAFKNNAGKGSIPSEAAPFYYLMSSDANATFLELFASFGIFVPMGTGWTIAENGIVKYQGINPEIKEPLKYLQELYRLGLTPPEVLTDDGNVFVRKRSAVPSVLGYYTSYALDTSDFIPIAPLNTPSGKQPFTRYQPMTGGPDRALAIFDNCKDPVAVVKLAEFIAVDVEASMNNSRGMKDILWRFRPDGKVEQIFWNESSDLIAQNSKNLGFWNSFINFWPREFFETTYYDVDDDTVNSRGWAYQHIYRNYPTPAQYQLPLFMNIGEDQIRLNALGSDINSERLRTISTWITTNANIDAEWDAYVARIMALGYNEWIALVQRSYDLMMQ